MLKGPALHKCTCAVIGDTFKHLLMMISWIAPLRWVTEMKPHGIIQGFDGPLPNSLYLVKRKANVGTAKSCEKNEHLLSNLYLLAREKLRLLEHLRPRKRPSWHRGILGVSESGPKSNFNTIQDW